jgi:hypothetical protein
LSQDTVHGYCHKIPFMGIVTRYRSWVLSQDTVHGYCHKIPFMCICICDLSWPWLSCLRPFVYCSPILLNYLAFKYFDIERTWWRLFQGLRRAHYIWYLRFYFNFCYKIPSMCIVEHTMHGNCLKIRFISTVARYCAWVTSWR